MLPISKSSVLSSNKSVIAHCAAANTVTLHYEFQFFVYLRADVGDEWQLRRQWEHIIILRQLKMNVKSRMFKLINLKIKIKLKAGKDDYEYCSNMIFDR